MRIREIHIDGFGRFSGVDFGPLERPVTVFYGPNEAGKSTLLEFVRRVLFGFPDGRSRTNLYPPLTGGSHGGRITVEDKDGQRYGVSRTAGRHGGAVTITTVSGEPQDEATLARLLGHQSRDVFEQVFAFTLEELHSGDLLETGSVNQQIYSAGMGAAKLPIALDTLAEQKRRLFLNRGSKHVLHTAAGDLERVVAVLKDVENNAAEYSRKSARLREIERRLSELQERRLRFESELQSRQNLEHAWGHWNDLVSAERDLTDLPVIDRFPQNGISRLDILENLAKVARGELDGAVADVKEAEAGTKVQVQHETIRMHSAEIGRLQNGRTAFDDFVKDLPEREASLAQLENNLRETLKDLGPDWDETRLEEFDLSIAVRQEIAEHRDQLGDASHAHSSRKSTLSQNTVALEEAVVAESKAQHELESSAAPNLDLEGVRQRRNLIRATRSRLDEIGRQRQNTINLQNQLDGLESAASPPGGRDRSRAVAAGVFVVGLALLIGGATLGETALFIGVAASIALGAVAGYLFMSRKQDLAVAVESPLAGPIRESLRRAEADVQELLSKTTQEAAPLGLEEIDESSLIAAEESVDEEEGLLRERARLSEALTAAKDWAKRRRARAEESAAAVDETARRLDAAQRGWQQWLKARGLLDTFTPETAEVLQGQVELGRSRLGEVRSWQQRVKGIERRIDEYVEAVESLATVFDVTFDRSDLRTVAAAADRLVELLEEVQEIVRKRTDAEAELRHAERQLEDRRGDLKRAEEELEQLLRSGDAENAEEFRKRAEIHRQRAELERKQRDALNQLQRISGPGVRLESLKKSLSETDMQTIGDEMRRIEEGRKEVTAQIDELNNERGSISNNLISLTSEEESSKQRARQHQLLEEIRDNARVWTVRTIAENLLKEAQRKFEKERQPDVIRNSEGFFHDITNGSYRTVFSPLGRSEIHVTDADGQTRQPSELSRGTREQLFLSLRFGLIRELGQRTEPLPVVVDEILVNFDPDRALRAAVAFTKLSCTNQILVFTCHPTVVELFRDAASEVGADEPDLVTIS